MEDSKEKSLENSSNQVEQLWSKSVELEKELKSLLKKKTVFDKNVVQIRNNLKTNFEQIIFLDYEFACDKDVEMLLWKSVFYKLIEEYRKRIRKIGSIKSETPNAELTKLCDAFSNFLESSTRFYNSLIVKLKNKHGLKLDGSVDYKIDSQSSSNKIHRSFLTCHRCLIYLGDLARYHRDIIGPQKENWERAGQFYCQALYLVPDNGNPHNQLAVLATYADDDFLAIYHYFRSITVVLPFPTARDNLIVAFEKNRIKYNELDAKNNSSVDPSASSLLTKFVRLQGMLFTKTSLEKFEGLCNEVSNLFGQLISKNFSNSNSDYNSFADLCLKMIAINISSVENNLQDKESGDNEKSVKSSIYLDYGLLMCFSIAEKMTKSLSEVFSTLVDSNLSFSLMLGTIGVFMDYLGNHPEFIRRSITPEETSERKSLLEISKNFMSQSEKLASESSKLLASKGDKNVTDETSLKEELELKGFVPLKQYRNLPFDSKIIAPRPGQSISQQEMENHQRKRLRKIVQFGTLLNETTKSKENEVQVEIVEEKNTAILTAPIVSNNANNSIQNIITPSNAALQKTLEQVEEEEEGEHLLNTLNSLNPLEDEEIEYATSSGNILDEEEPDDEIILYRPPSADVPINSGFKDNGMDALMNRNYHSGSLAPAISSSPSMKNSYHMGNLQSAIIPPKTSPSSIIPPGLSAIGSGRTSSPPILPTLNSMMLGENSTVKPPDSILGYSFDQLFGNSSNSFSSAAPSNLSQNGNASNGMFLGGNMGGYSNNMNDQKFNLPNKTNSFVNQGVQNSPYFPSSAPSTSAVYSSNHQNPAPWPSTSAGNMGAPYSSFNNPSMESNQTSSYFGTNAPLSWLPQSGGIPQSIGSPRNNLSGSYQYPFNGNQQPQQMNQQPQSIGSHLMVNGQHQYQQPNPSAYGNPNPQPVPSGNSRGPPPGFRTANPYVS